MLPLTALPTDLVDLLRNLGDGALAFPLQLMEGGRFPTVNLFPSAHFKACRMPEEARAGLLLYAGFGTQSHAASQALSSREGTYWHGVYHRLEPDDWNAKYWFRQVGPHEIGPALAEASRVAGWDPGHSWDHSRFVDFTASARNGRDPAKLKIAETVQLAEWQFLFSFCAKDKSE